MTCVICKHGQLVAGTTTINRNTAGKTLVLKDVPALVCDNCGETYLEDAIVDAVDTLARDYARSGAEVVVAAYSAAA